MEELQLTLTPARVDQRNFGVMLSNWRVGQVLNALVVDTRPNSGVLLSVGGKQFVATTDLPVQPGTRMAMEVQKVGEEIVLKRVQEQALQPANSSARAAETALALSSARPAGLLNLLAAQPARFGSPDVQELAKDLMGRAPRGDNLKPGQLQRAMKQSGLFAEADLASGRTAAARQSTKSTLSQLQTLALALADDLDEASAETRVLRQIGERAGALLNGIASNQLASVPSDDEEVLRWVFTLPVQVGDQFQDVRMQIEREPRTADEDAGESWHATINVDLPRLGSVDINLRMARGAVRVDFVCDSPRSASILDRSMGALEQRLIERDLRVGHLGAEAADAAARPGPVAGDSGFSVEA